MKRFLLSLLFLMGIFTNQFAQTSMWDMYTNADYVRFVVCDDPHLWVSYRGGLTKINVNTDEKEFYNVKNSEIPGFVNTLAIDTQKNVWVGTHVGLGKLQGDTWIIYDTSNSEIPGIRIRELAIDGSGNLWVGSSKKDSKNTIYYLSKFDGTTWTNYNSNNSMLPETGVNNIAIEQDNTIWASTAEGLLKISGDDWTLYNSENSNLAFNNVYNIVVDNENVKWMIAGNEGLLVSFDDDIWENHENIMQLIHHIYVDSDNVKWLCGCKGYGNNFIGGIAKFDGQNYTHYNSENSNLLTDYISSIAIDNNGTKWVGTEKMSVIKSNNEDWIKINCSNSELPSCCITSIEIDNEGKMWFAGCSYEFPYYDPGIAMFSESVWDSYRFFENSTEGISINDIIVDNQNNTWLCSNIGLIKYIDDLNWIIYNTSNSILNSNRTNCGVVDENGIVWIGLLPDYSGIGGGLLKINGDDLSLFTPDNSDLPNSYVNAITTDNIGNLWMGVSGDWSNPEPKGLVNFNSNNWTFYNTTNSGLPDTDIRYIEVSTTGEVWLAAGGGEDGGGLIRFFDNEWTIYNTSNSDIPFDWVSTISIDIQDVVWFSAGNYLLSLNNNEWTSLRINENLWDDDYIYALKCDNLGNKWLGTEAFGVIVYNENGSSAIFEKVKTKNNTLIINPNPADYLASIEFELNDISNIYLSVYTIDGKRIFNKYLNNLSQGSNKIELNTSKFDNGTYVISINSKNYNMTGRLIILK
jgi:ligand-binding sensor domain-containing protein